jgi:predicted Rossmann fold nucleotide-binding protein DprA/Smf involved in DNA uptake
MSRSRFPPTYLYQHEALYPPALCLHLADRAPATLTLRGNLNILCGKAHAPLVALFCSVQCSSALILETYELAGALRDAGVTVISGFHSPMEKECLAVLLRGTQPVIVCPARSIENMRLPADWKAALTQDRLLLVSPFEERLCRVTTERAQKRNEVVAALSDVILVAYAAPDSKTAHFCSTMLSWGKPLLALENKENIALLALGARPIRPESFSAHQELVTRTGAGNTTSKPTST